MTKYIKGLIILSIFFAACSKSKSPVTPTNPPPTNLTVTAVASTDSSGNVAITAKATNATSYNIDFGNDTAKTVASGVITYRYAQPGTYSITVVATNASGQTITATTNVTIAVRLKLVWSDEFNTDGPPDPSKWSYNLGNNSGWGNNELENYTSDPANVIVQNGVLKITAIKENSAGYQYSSARIVTDAKFSFTYGRVEIRAMLPSGLGTWPALWMLGQDYATQAWPACGEMDIMEQIGKNPTTVYGTLHYPGHSGANGNQGTTTVQNTSTQFHIYGLQWSPTAVQISVDGVVFQTVQNNPALPFNAPFFFIFNIAMGGDFGGTVDPNFVSSSMQVDYVRVYQ
ncbi:family 16 glycosylhydrolase [Mucilaginibacter sp. E4BP6]|uniref:family 16 glycosylhydrolase n=1 Tax=Mucilaginibacter sp. E4BP6 TaxID=2723089 RepID=UPI0015CA75BE|nr:family 16 glycosylhydrolase [Mucilaginibacter sp. E4BP6]NYE68221.1 beta-glucanase (GH16 family) [Mucilaginibacter sp. E4BP6]